MTNDELVGRLRKGETHGILIPCEDLKDAADAIQRLEEEVSEWKQAASVEAGLRREAHAQLASARKALMKASLTDSERVHDALMALTDEQG